MKGESVPIASTMDTDQTRQFQNMDHVSIFLLLEQDKSSVLDIRQITSLQYADKGGVKLIAEGDEPHGI